MSAFFLEISIECSRGLLNLKSESRQRGKAGTDIIEPTETNYFNLRVMMVVEQSSFSSLNLFFTQKILNELCSHCSDGCDYMIY